MNVWDEILQHIRNELPDEDFRRWFGSTAYVADAGDRITVWVATESIRRHISSHFEDEINAALHAINRDDTTVRFIVGGGEDDED